jgi:hypothetical protein
MNDDHPPLVAVPDGLGDRDAATLLNLLDDDPPF